MSSMLMSSLLMSQAAVLHYHMPVSEIDPFSAAYFENPYPAQAALRAAGPVVYLRRHDIYGVARHAEVQAVLNDSVTYCSSRGVGFADFATEAPWQPPNIVLEADPPDHTAARRVLSRILAAPVVATLRRRFAEAADTLVRSLLERDGVDGVTDIAEAFPLSVFPDAVGLSRDGREHLLPYASLASNAFGPDNELRRAALQTAAPHAEWVERHVQRDRLRPDGFGARIYEAADREEIPHAQAPLLLRSLLTAGIDTSVNSLAAALHCLMRFPAQWQYLRTDRTLARAAFQEAIRLESPVQTCLRTTTRPVSFNGIAVDQGRKIITFLGAANRDPRKFDEPDAYDITRRIAGHVGFGSGIHMCVGQLLATMEGEVLLQALATHVASIEPVGPAIRRHNNTLRGLASLPLRLNRQVA